jgi:hypothetical protein
MPRKGSITDEQRLLYNKRSRAKWYERSRHDAEWKTAQIRKRTDWNKRKVARCPKYSVLMQLRKNKIRIRESIEFHQDQLARREREMLKIVKDIVRLSAECRGK